MFIYVYIYFFQKYILNIDIVLHTKYTGIGLVY